MFDVYEDSYQGFRIAQNVNQEWVDEYCKYRGLSITRKYRRSTSYFDLYVK